MNPVPAEIAAPLVELADLPLVPMERFLIRNDSPINPMVFRVLMRFDGPYDADKLSQAFCLAAIRQPMFLRCISGEERQAVWTLKEQSPQPIWLAPGLSEEQFTQIPVHPIDLQKSQGMRCQIGPIPTGIVILLDLHHACSDGQGARQFLGEWFGFYQQLLQSGRVQPVEVHPQRLLERGYFRTPTPPIGTWEGLRNLYLTICGRTVRLPVQHPDASLPEPLAEHVFSIEQTAVIRKHLKRLQVSINDACLTAAFSAWIDYAPQVSRRGYITIMHPVDLRWPSDLRTPACNRFGVTFLRRKQKDCRNPEAMLQSVRLQMKYIKQRYVGAEFVRGLQAADGIPGGTHRIQSWGWFVPTFQFTCLGDTTRAMHYRFDQVQGAVNFQGLELQRISGFMQVGPFLPLSLAACETSQRLSLTARASSRHFDQPGVDRFLGLFVERLRQLLEHAS